MFAIPKLIIVVLVVAAAWMGYRWLNGVTRHPARRPVASPRTPINAEDLTACGVCGALLWPAGLPSATLTISPPRQSLEFPIADSRLAEVLGEPGLRYPAALR